MSAPVVVLTAAAHRAGKRVGDQLVDDGWDIAFWSLAVLRSRVVHAEAKGRRAVALRGNIADPRSVAFLVAETTERFPTVDAVVHLDADELALDETGTDPATSALVELGAVKVVYVAATAFTADVALSWCATHEVDALVLDAADKIHNIAPAVAAFLARA